MNCSSSATSRQLSGTQTAPSLAIAKKLSMNSGLFISSRATRSPLLHASTTRRMRYPVAARVELAEIDAPARHGRLDHRLDAGAEEGPPGEELSDVHVHGMAFRRRAQGAGAEAERISSTSTWRVFERGKVAAVVELVPVHEAFEALLGPAPRATEDLLREEAEPGGHGPPGRG